MEYTTLGKTGLRVSVAGLGCGGNSRLGLTRGASVDECVAVARTAIDLGVNFLDTAEVYGTEEIVGAAVRHYDRDRLVISTKALLRAGDTPATVTQRVEAGLRRLGLDYVDVFHFHAVNPSAYAHHRDVLAPALVRLKEQGKVRHVGITETGPNDPEQKMLTQAIEDEPWEVIMLAYSLMNQGARHKVFPVTRRRGIGTLLMFVVRNIFSNAAYRAEIFARLVEQGQLDASILADGDPLGFLVSDGGAESITDAAYRYARHEQGADVILFGTGSKAHVADNVASILRPPLAPATVDRLHASFGHLTGVGLDRPGPVGKPA
jgi:aryl-alcohol dehydrogenase-like predicted oxidoreductase